MDPSALDGWVQGRSNAYAAASDDQIAMQPFAT